MLTSDNVCLCADVGNVWSAEAVSQMITKDCVTVGVGSALGYTLRYIVNDYILWYASHLDERWVAMMPFEQIVMLTVGREESQTAYSWWMWLWKRCCGRREAKGYRPEVFIDMLLACSVEELA